MNENRKIRFNIVDVIIIFLIIACVVGVVFRGTIKEKLGKTLSNETVYVTLVAENVPREYIDAFVQGSNAYCEGDDLGVIIGYSYTEQTTVVLDLNEKYEYKGKYLNRDYSDFKKHLNRYNTIFINMKRFIKYKNIVKELKKTLIDELK